MKLPSAFFCLRLWVLAWFVMALGTAMASPFVQPKTIEIVCAGAGTGSTQIVVRTDGGAVESNAHNLDCPLCLVSGAPPAATSALASVFLPLSYASAIALVTPVVAASATPPPARAPPIPPEQLLATLKR